MLELSILVLCVNQMSEGFQTAVQINLGFTLLHQCGSYVGRRVQPFHMFRWRWVNTDKQVLHCGASQSLRVTCEVEIFRAKNRVQCLSEPFHPEDVAGILFQTHTWGMGELDSAGVLTCAGNCTLASFAKWTALGWAC